MAKNKAITPRGELVKLARDLGCNLPEREFKQLLDSALQSPDPRAFIEQQVGGRGTGDEGREPDVGCQGEEDALLVPAPLAPVLRGEGPGVRGEAETDPTAPIPDLPTQLAAEEITFPDPTYWLVPNLAATPCPGHLTRHVELQLTKYPLAREALTRLRHHLDQSNARLSTGRHVANAGGALIWLLEQLGTAAGLGGTGRDKDRTEGEA